LLLNPGVWQQMAEQGASVLAPGTKRSLRGRFRQPCIKRGIGQQLAHRRRQCGRFRLVASQTSSSRRHLAQGPIGAANTGTAKPETFLNRQTKTFDQRRVHREAAFPVWQSLPGVSTLFHTMSGHYFSGRPHYFNCTVYYTPRCRQSDVRIRVFLL
jgi:hypothetical protein